MNKLPDNIYEYGKCCIIACARKTNGAVPAKEFLGSLDIKARVKFKRLFVRMCQEGKINNIQQFKKLHSDCGLWEFKVKPYRVLTFRNGNTWFLTHGFKKDADETPSAEIKRGENIMVEHLKRK